MINFLDFLTWRFWLLLSVLIWPFMALMGIIWGQGQTNKGEVGTWITGLLLCSVMTALFFLCGIAGSYLVKLLLYFGV